MLLTSLDNVKSFLEKTDMVHDDLLTLIITGISSRIELYLNRNLEKIERTQYYNAGRRFYSLPAYPIDLNLPFTVYVDDLEQDINDDYYVWEDSGVVEFYYIPMYAQPKQIRIVWTGGYLSNVIPAEIEYAAILQSAFLFRRRKDIGLSSVSLPDGSMNVNNPTDLLPDVKSLLKSLRRKPEFR